MSLLADEPAFRRLWTGQTVSLVGDQVSLLALPLVAVLGLDAGAGRMGVLTAAGVLPYLLFAVVAGGLVDRAGRRRHVMVAADLGRAALLLVVPVHALVGRPAFVELVAVAFLVGTCSVLFSVAYSSLFAAVVAPDRYVEANALLSGSRSLATLAGPAAAGVLVQAVGAPAALVADAGSFVTSAACLRGVRATEPPAAAAGDLAGGVRFLRRSPALRAALAATAMVNLGSFVWWAVLVLFLTRTLDLSPSAVGVVLAGGAVGGLVGTALTGRLVRAAGLWRSLAVGCVVFAVPVLAVPFARGMAIPLAAEVVSGLGVVVLDISAASLLAELVPDGLRSRVQGAYLTVNHGMRPVGALLGGALGAAVGTRAAIGIGAAVALTGVVWLRQPSRASSSARRSSVRASSLR